MNNPLKAPQTFLPGFVLVLFGLLSPLTAPAQSDLAETRLLRSLRADARGESATLKGMTEKPEEWTQAWSIGAAFTNLSGAGEAWNIPWQFEAKRGKHSILLQSDGYTDVSGPEAAAGFSDILAQYRQRVWRSDDATDSISIGLAATVPVGGEVGSDHTSERLSISRSIITPDDLLLIFAASISRSEAAADTGGNPYRQSLSILAAGKLLGVDGTFLQLLTSHANGSRWGTSLAVGIEFSLSEKVTGTLSLVRGVSEGNEDTSVGFDLSW